MRSTSFATQGALCTSSWSKSLSVSRGRRSRSPSLLARHACVLELAVRRHLADMAMFDPRAHPLHAALGFVLVPPDERGCRKTCGIGRKRTQTLGMGFSTLKLVLHHAGSDG